MARNPQAWFWNFSREFPAKACVEPDLETLRAEFATKAELAELKSDMRSLRADVASDLLVMRKALSEQIVGLRCAVVDYHTSVVGHGRADQRSRRPPAPVELHLNLPPMIAG